MMMIIVIIMIMMKMEMVILMIGATAKVWHKSDNQVFER